MSFATVTGASWRSIIYANTLATGECAVIVEQRTYTFAPGKVQSYIERFFVEALPIMREHLGEPLGCFTAETGELNQFVHLWGYASMADREMRRAALYGDPQWLEYIRRAGADGRVDHQHTKLLRAVDVPPAR